MEPYDVIVNQPVVIDNVCINNFNLIVIIYVLATIFTSVKIPLKDENKPCSFFIRKEKKNLFRK